MYNSRYFLSFFQNKRSKSEVHLFIVIDLESVFKSEMNVINISFFHSDMVTCNKSLYVFHRLTNEIDQSQFGIRDQTKTDFSHRILHRLLTLGLLTSLHYLQLTSCALHGADITFPN